jgi:DNA (cytosine-5)-methyltransferase 1
MLCHPTELRPLSVGEYTRLQQFPEDWVFAGGIPQQYIQCGNAVPLGLGKAIGLAIRKAMRGEADPELCGKVVCADLDLLQRMADRPRTILNPRRMRIDGTLAAAKKWLNTNGRYRQSLLKLVDHENDDEAQDASRNGKPKLR